MSGADRVGALRRQSQQVLEVGLAHRETFRSGVGGALAAIAYEWSGDTGNWARSDSSSRARGGSSAPTSTAKLR
jgi:hypothetical protein